MKSTRLGFFLLAAVGIAACGDDSTAAVMDASAAQDTGVIAQDGGQLADGGESPDGSTAALTREEFCTQFIALYAEGSSECCSNTDLDPADAMVAAEQVCSYVLSGAMWDSNELTFDPVKAQTLLGAYETAIATCATDLEASLDLYRSLGELVTGSRAAGADCLDPSGGEEVDGSYSYVCAPGLHCATTYSSGGDPTASCVADKTMGQVCFDGETFNSCATGLTCLVVYEDGVGMGTCGETLPLGSACESYGDCASRFCDFEATTSTCATPPADILYCPSFG